MTGEEIFLHYGRLPSGEFFKVVEPSEGMKISRNKLLVSETEIGRWADELHELEFLHGLSLDQDKINTVISPLVRPNKGKSKKSFGKQIKRADPFRKFLIRFLELLPGEKKKTAKDVYKELLNNKALVNKADPEGYIEMVNPNNVMANNPKIDKLKLIFSKSSTIKRIKRLLE